MCVTHKPPAHHNPRTYSAHSAFYKKSSVHSWTRAQRALQKLSIMYTAKLLETKNMLNDLEYFNNHSKKDDLADCFLQLKDAIKKQLTSAINIK